MTVLGLDFLADTSAASWKYAACVLPALLLWLTAVVFYRRYCHPLSQVPGPFLPAVTRLYLWYYSVVQEGQFYKHIGRWHEAYGEITTSN